MEESLIDLLVENHKIEKLLQNIIEDMSNSNDYKMQKGAEKYSRQLEWFHSRNEAIKDKNGIKIEDLEGKKFIEGYNVEVINRDEVIESKELTILQMLEPIVIQNGKVIRSGKIIIG